MAKMKVPDPISDATWSWLLTTGWQPPVHWVEAEVYDNRGMAFEDKIPLCGERRGGGITKGWSAVTCPGCIAKNNVVVVDFGPSVEEKQRRFRERMVAYQKLDPPLLCEECRRWMRMAGGKTRARSYLQRRKPKHAGTCIECAVSPCSEGCAQCRVYVKDHGTATYHLRGCGLPIYHRGKCKPILALVDLPKEERGG